MEYGARWRHVGKAALISFAWGLPCAAALACMGCPLALSFLMMTAVCLIYPGLVGLFAVFRMRVRDNYVEHVFLNRWVIQRRRLSRFVRIDGDWGDTEVVFENGKTLRTLNMPTEEVERMRDELTVRAAYASKAEKAGCDHPAHAVVLSSEWLHWQDETVKKVAWSLVEEKAFDRLGILADALEDAGCTDEVILSHLRSPGPHARGCWALDLALGKG
jgi:hypothetical protein